MVKPKLVFDPVVKIEGFVDSKIDLVEVSVGSWAEEEDVVVELVCFLAEIALF